MPALRNSSGTSSHSLGLTRCLGVTNSQDSSSLLRGFFPSRPLPVSGIVAEAIRPWWPSRRSPVERLVCVGLDVNVSAVRVVADAAAAAIGLMDPLELEEPSLLRTQGSSEHTASLSEIGSQIMLTCIRKGTQEEAQENCKLPPSLSWPNFLFLIRCVSDT